MDEIYEMLLEHLVIHSHSISFPELALPVILKVGNKIDIMKVNQKVLSLGQS